MEPFPREGGVEGEVASNGALELPESLMQREAPSTDLLGMSEENDMGLGINPAELDTLVGQSSSLDSSQPGFMQHEQGDPFAIHSHSNLNHAEDLAGHYSSVPPPPHHGHVKPGAPQGDQQQSMIRMLQQRVLQQQQYPPGYHGPPAPPGMIPRGIPPGGHPMIRGGPYPQRAPSMMGGGGIGSDASHHQVPPPPAPKNYGPPGHHQYGQGQQHPPGARINQPPVHPQQMQHSQHVYPQQPRPQMQHQSMHPQQQHQQMHHHQQHHQMYPQHPMHPSQVHWSHQVPQPRPSPHPSQMHSHAMQSGRPDWNEPWSKPPPGPPPRGPGGGYYETGGIQDRGDVHYSSHGYGQSGSMRQPTHSPPPPPPPPGNFFEAPENMPYPRGPGYQGWNVNGGTGYPPRAASFPGQAYPPPIPIGGHQQVHHPTGGFAQSMADQRYTQDDGAPTRRSSRLRTKAPVSMAFDGDNIDDDDEFVNDEENVKPLRPKKVAVSRKKGKSRKAADDDDDDDAASQEDVQPSGGAGRVSFVEMFLHVATKKRSEWREIMSKMNTSKVINGSRLQEEKLGLIAIAAPQVATENEDIETRADVNGVNQAYPRVPENNASAMLEGQEAAMVYETGPEPSSTDSTMAADPNNNEENVEFQQTTNLEESIEKSPTSTSMEVEGAAPATKTVESKANANDNDGDVLEERFLVKWRDASHLHVSWETESDLITKLVSELAGARIDARCKRARTQIRNPYEKQGYYNPDMRVAERVLDVRPEGLLIKWAVLGYDEATYETEEDLKNSGVSYDKQQAAYYKREQAKEALSRIPQNERQRRLFQREMLPQVSESPEYKNGLKLRPYQLEALNWLCFNWCQNRNSILADEMGLGKTAQAISFANVVGKDRGPVMVVAPLATLSHWQREIERWTDLNVVVMRGSAGSRAACKQLEFWVDPETRDWYKFDVLVTNFECVLQDEEALTRCPYSLLIVDEAHRLKNRKSKLTMLLRERLEFAACLLLTGTPIQNDTTELWTLLNFVDRERFNSLEEFAAKFGNLTTAKDMDEFHETLRPYLLRRFKVDVEATLPSKEEIIVEVELTELQKYYYRSVYEQNVQTLLRGVAAGTRVNLNNVAMQLRKCCNHPFLIEGVEAKAIQDEVERSGGMTPQREMELLVSASGKTILLDKLLPKLHQQKHRVLIFSQFVRMLDILEDYMRFRQYGYERIDGSISGMRRQEAIDRFSEPNSSSFAFLLSTRGCGQGINLTSADTVIMFDSDWNPQNDVQAQARCHRIGQTKPVVIYRLITRKTYEQEMFTRASLKLGLDEAVNSKLQQQAPADDGEEEAKLAAGVSDQELEHMLKYGAYALRGGDDENEAKAFNEADIDDILNRARRVKSVEPSANPREQRFSKATFVSRSSGAVDVEDPQFWSKVLGKDLALVEDEDEEAKTLGKGKRKRRAVQSFTVSGGDTASRDDENDEVWGPQLLREASPVGSGAREYSGERPALSKAGLKALINATALFGFESPEILAKKVTTLNDKACSKFSLGIVLTAVVWQALEASKNTETPYCASFDLPSDPADDGTSLINSVASLTEWLKKEEQPDLTGCGVRAIVTTGVKRALTAEREVEVTKDMALHPRLKDRFKETLTNLADQMEVVVYNQNPWTLPGVRGVPPSEGWKKIDDVAMLKACEYFGFDRKRKPEIWRDIFNDQRLKWTTDWHVELDDDPSELSKQKTHKVHIKRLISRFNRVVNIITTGNNKEEEAGEEEGGLNAVKPSALMKKLDVEVETGERTAEWSAAELERLSALLMRWGNPLEDFGQCRISEEILGASPPTFEKNFAQYLPRKNMEDITSKTKEVVEKALEAASKEDRAVIPSQKRLVSRIATMTTFWKDVLGGFADTEGFLRVMGWYFRGLSKLQSMMPSWWMPQHDMGLLRGVCKHGLNVWSEVLSDRSLFPPAPSIAGQNAPDPTLLNRRFSALLDWMLVHHQKAIPTSVDLEEALTRGYDLMRLATTDEMIERATERQGAEAEMVERREAKLKAKEAIAEKKRSAKEAKEMKKKLRQERKEAKLRAKQEAKAAAKAARKAARKEEQEKAKKSRRKSTQNVAAGVQAENVAAPPDSLVVPTPISARQSRSAAASSGRSKRRKKDDSDDEEEVWVRNEPSRRRRRSLEDDAAAAIPAPPPPAKRIRSSQNLQELPMSTRKRRSKRGEDGEVAANSHQAVPQLNAAAQFNSFGTVPAGVDIQSLIASGALPPLDMQQLLPNFAMMQGQMGAMGGVNVSALDPQQFLGNMPMGAPLGMMNLSTGAQLQFPGVVPSLVGQLGGGLLPGKGLDPQQLQLLSQMQQTQTQRNTRKSEKGNRS